MAAIGITGGPGCGKTTFANLLAKALPAACFDADQAIRELMAGNPDVQSEVATLMNRPHFDNSSEVRSALRHLVMNDETKRRQLEAILHPRIRDTWWNQAAEQRGHPKQHFVAELPLLYEKSLAAPFDVVVAVAAGTFTQYQRLRDRGLDDQLISQLIQAQMPLKDKIRQAAVVAWNDGNREALAGQAAQLVQTAPWSA